MPTTIKIDNVASPTSPRALTITRYLQGESYMDLQVHFAPVGGSFDALVETEYPTTTAELTQMACSLLISAAQAAV